MWLSMILEKRMVFDMRNLVFEKTTPVVASFYNRDYPMSLYIIKSGYEGRYLVVNEDVIESNLQLMTIPEIEKMYGVEVDL